MGDSAITVLVVDASPAGLVGLVRQVHSAAGRLVLIGVARGCDEAEEIVRSNPGVVVTLGARLAARDAIARLHAAGARAVVVQGGGNREFRTEMAARGAAAVVERSAPDEWLHAAIENAYAFRAPALDTPTSASAARFV